MFHIITDTAANLPTNLANERNIKIIPISYYENDTEYTCSDTEEFDGKTFYDAMRKGADVQTSQLTPQRYIDFMMPILESGEDLLFIGLSSGVSGSFASAEIAARQLQESYPQQKIRLVDSLGASLGEGLLALKADDYRKKGMTLDETADLILALRDRMYQVFTVDDLNYLYKSGRLSNLSAKVGTLLNVKPLLKGNELGQIVAFAKLRGKKRAMIAIAEKYRSLVKNPESQIIGIAHADCPEDAEFLAELLRRDLPPMEILTVCYEPVTGSHVGPGTLALFFEGSENVRYQ